MKKRILTFLIALAVALSLALSLSACNLFQRDIYGETIYGHWETEKLIMDQSDYPFESPFNITVYNDGSVSAGNVFSWNYAEGHGTWTEEDGVYTIEITYELSDGLSTESYSGTINKNYLILRPSLMPYTYYMAKTK